MMLSIGSTVLPLTPVPNSVFQDLYLLSIRSDRSKTVKIRHLVIDGSLLWVSGGNNTRIFDITQKKVIT